MRIPRRTLLLLAGLALVAPGSASGQAIDLGVWGGFTSSNQVTTDLTLCNVNGCRPTEMWPHYGRDGHAVGVMARREITRWLAVRGELMITPKGYGAGERSDSRVSSRYLELPLLAEARLPRLGPVQVRLAGGLAPSLLVSCERDVGGISSSTIDSCSDGGSGYPTPGPASSYDLGWVIAPGLAISMNGGDLLLEARHVRGLVDLSPETHGRTLNRFTVVALGYAWRIR